MQARLPLASCLCPWLAALSVACERPVSRSARGSRGLGVRVIGKVYFSVLAFIRAFGPAAARGTSWLPYSAALVQWRWIRLCAATRWVRSRGVTLVSLFFAPLPQAQEGRGFLIGAHLFVLLWGKAASAGCVCFVLLVPQEVVCCVCA